MDVWSGAEAVNFSCPNRDNKGLKPLAAPRSRHGEIGASDDLTINRNPFKSLEIDVDKFAGQFRWCFAKYQSKCFVHAIFGKDDRRAGG